MALTPGTLTVMLDAAWRVTLRPRRRLGRRAPAGTSSGGASPRGVGHGPPGRARRADARGVAAVVARGRLPSPEALAVAPSSPNVPPSRPMPRPSPAKLATHAQPAPTDCRAGADAAAAAAGRAAPRARPRIGWVWCGRASPRRSSAATSPASRPSAGSPVTPSRCPTCAGAMPAMSRQPNWDCRESPALLASEHVTVPFTSGVLRPVVVVPATALATWTDERIRVVLLHELAHVRRRDCLVQAMSQVACAAYWFNPLTWIAARRLRAERERACDDLVLEAGHARRRLRAAPAGHRAHCHAAPVALGGGAGHGASLRARGTAAGDSRWTSRPPRHRRAHVVAHGRGAGRGGRARGQRAAGGAGGRPRSRVAGGAGGANADPHANADADSGAGQRAAIKHRIGGLDLGVVGDVDVGPRLDGSRVGAD